MTYPRYRDPSPEDFERMARLEGVPLLRNDLLFERLVAEGGEQRYLFDDGYHPRPEGYRLIAESIRDLIMATPELRAALAQPASAGAPG